MFLITIPQLSNYTMSRNIINISSIIIAVLIMRECHEDSVFLEKVFYVIKGSFIVHIVYPLGLKIKVNRLLHQLYFILQVHFDWVLHQVLKVKNAICKNKYIVKHSAFN